MNETLTHKHLLRLFDLWHLLLPNQGYVLFAFRGLTPVSPSPNWKKCWRLTPKKVDYIHMHCSIGIWNTVSQSIYIAPGSTVPHKSQVELAVAKGGKGANQLEPGFYNDYKKGIHGEAAENGHQALRQSSNRFIRRTVRGIPYTNNDPLFFSNPYDNLHCGWQMDPSKKNYSSAGCIVVAGHAFAPKQPDPKPNAGFWKIIHNILYSTSQRRYAFLLLDASQIRRSFKRNPKGRFFCYGSSGPEVQRLQSFLKSEGIYKGGLSGQLDARTYKAWNQTGFADTFQN